MYNLFRYIVYFFLYRLFEMLKQGEHWGCIAPPPPPPPPNQFLESGDAYAHSPSPEPICLGGKIYPLSQELVTIYRKNPFPGFCLGKISRDECTKVYVALYAVNWVGGGGGVTP